MTMLILLLLVLSPCVGQDCEKISVYGIGAFGSWGQIYLRGMILDSTIFVFENLHWDENQHRQLRYYTSKINESDFDYLDSLFHNNQYDTISVRLSERVFDGSSKTLLRRHGIQSKYVHHYETPHAQFSAIHDGFTDLLKSYATEDKANFVEQDYFDAVDNFVINYPGCFSPEEEKMLAILPFSTQFDHPRMNREYIIQGGESKRAKYKLDNLRDDTWKTSKYYKTGMTKHKTKSLGTIYLDANVADLDTSGILLITDEDLYTSIYRTIWSDMEFFPVDFESNVVLMMIPDHKDQIFYHRVYKNGDLEVLSARSGVPRKTYKVWMVTYDRETVRTYDGIPIN